jgi:heme/copper-type cytochrome/quinol oxidase subunit 3
MTTFEPVWTQRPTRSLGWWGMLVAVATEATLFATLIGSYFYLRFQATTWPPHGIPKPHVLLPCVLTALLASSSLPLFVATHLDATRRVALLRACLFAPFALGLVYTVLQFVQYTRDWSDVRPSGSAYGSIYFTLNGLLWAHVVAGVLLALFVQYQARHPAYRPERTAAVQVTALYWHFVNLTAIAVLLTAYLSPQL